MSDRDALLAAIRAQPDEDTPRLIFADWLEVLLKTHCTAATHMHALSLFNARSWPMYR